MQILIDISEDAYAQIINENGIDTMLIPYKDIIKNGTVLPEGHGDLIDRKELLKQPMDKANYPSNYVKIAPTIIEADVAESEYKE